MGRLGVLWLKLYDCYVLVCRINEWVRLDRKKSQNHHGHRHSIQSFIKWCDLRKWDGDVIQVYNLCRSFWVCLNITNNFILSKKYKRKKNFKTTFYLFIFFILGSPFVFLPFFLPFSLIYFSQFSSIFSLPPTF